MSNPYIQVELDAGKKAAVIAAALGVSKREILGGLTEMWMHIYGEGKGDTVSAFLLRAFFGLDGKVVADALVELGFLEVAGAVWRVRGASRYHRISEVRREAGRKGAAATNAKRSANAAASARQVPHDGSANGRQTVGNDEVEEGEDGVPHDRQKVGTWSANAAASARQVPRQNPENGRQKSALDPRSEIRDLKPLNQCQEGAATPARVQAPARDSAPSAPPPSRAPGGVDLTAETRHHGPVVLASWPDAECEAAGLAWYQRLNEKRPNGHGYTLDDVKRVAMERPELFAEAADEHVAGERGWQGGCPFRWLRRQCDFVAANRADKERKRRESTAGRRGPQATPEQVVERQQNAASANQHTAAWEGALAQPAPKLWQDALAKLEERFGWEAREWLRPLAVASLNPSAHSLHLIGPDETHETLVADSYREPIAQALGDLAGTGAWRVELGLGVNTQGASA